MSFWFEDSEDNIDYRLTPIKTDFWATIEGRKLEKKLIKKLKRALNNPSYSLEEKHAWVANYFKNRSKKRIEYYGVDYD